MSENYSTSKHCLPIQASAPISLHVFSLSFQIFLLCSNRNRFSTSQLSI
uniref:Uncharacterized protein n=1 Tax=Arundo donax TaxID=35708 RepID=A0A0A8ZT03_ARUDO